MMEGLMYSTPYQDITDVPHTKHYRAQAKEVKEMTMWAYDVIKLDIDLVYYVGWRSDEMKEYHAKAGEYLVQTVGQPPRVEKTWAELRTNFTVFQNKKGSEE